MIQLVQVSVILPEIFLNVSLLLLENGTFVALCTICVNLPANCSAFSKSPPDYKNRVHLLSIGKLQYLPLPCSVFCQEI